MNGGTSFATWNERIFGYFFDNRFFAACFTGGFFVATFAATCFGAAFVDFAFDVVFFFCAVAICHPLWCPFGNYNSYQKYAEDLLKTQALYGTLPKASKKQGIAAKKEGSTS